MHVLSNIAIKPDENALTTAVIPYLTNFTRLFMMVSAFSMCCGYYEKVRTGAITPKVFYDKRYARIWPFFAVMVVLSVLMDRSATSMQEGIADLTLCFNLYPSAKIETVGVGWFLGTVFTFYMLFPFFTYLMNTRRKAWMVLVVALMMVYIAENPLFEMGKIGRQNIIYSSPFFIVGGIIYLYKDRLATIVSAHRLLSAMLMVVVSVAAFLLPVNKVLGVNRELIFYAALTIYALGSTDIILNNAVTRYLSKVSMEVYLCHMMFFRVATMIHVERFVGDANVGYAVTCLLTLAGAIVFSHVMKFYAIPYAQACLSRTTNTTPEA